MFLSSINSQTKKYHDYMEIMSHKYASYGSNRKMQYMASGSKFMAVMRNDIIYQCVAATREALSKPYASEWPLNSVAIIFSTMNILQ